MERATTTTPGRIRHIAAALAVLCACTTDAAQPGFVPPMQGLWHLARGQAVDSYNLQVAPGGTFVWGVNGCDFLGGDRGRWEATAGGVRLLPRAGKAELLWFNTWSFQDAVTSVELAREGTEWVATPVPSQGAVRQRFQAGGECPGCTSECLGPCAPAKACANPYLPGD